MMMLRNTKFASVFSTSLQKFVWNTFEPSNVLSYLRETTMYYNAIIITPLSLRNKYHYLIYSSLCKNIASTLCLHNFFPSFLFLFQIFVSIFKREVKLRAIQNAIFIRPITPRSQVSIENINPGVSLFSAHGWAVQHMGFAELVFMPQRKIF